MTPLIPCGSMLQNYYGRLAAEAGERRRAEWAAIDTPEAAAGYVRHARARIEAAFGPFPERTSLEPEVTGKTEHDGVRMEKVLIQVCPNQHATLLVYRSTDAAPDARQPGILHLCGHSPNGKGGDDLQMLNLSLARMGMTVAIIDPLGQGERKQFSGYGFGPVREHNLAGKMLGLTGEFFGSRRVWDAMRALDYLASRPDVDAERLGVTGVSGGGTLSSYLFALDDRLKAAAPACFITTFARNFANELPTDAEQIPPGLWAAGGEMADFLIARAPAPSLILAVENDFFDPRGAVESFHELSQIHRLLGNPDGAGLFTGPGSHSYSPELRRAACRFFTEKFLGTPDAVVPELPAWPEEELRVSPSGQVADLPGEETIGLYLTRRTKELAAKRKPDATKIAAFLRSALQLETPVPTPEYRVLRSDWRPPRISRFALATEPGCEAFLHVPGGPEKLFHLPKCEQTVLYVAHLDAEEELKAGLPDLDAPGVPIWGLDVRGTGKSRPLTCDHNPDYFHMYDSDHFYDATGKLLNRSCFGGKVRDLLAALALLRSRGCRSVTLAGRGLGALAAACAAGIDCSGIDRIRLFKLPNSWAECCGGADLRWPQSHLIPGMLKVFDLPDLYRILGDRCDFSAVDFLDGMLQPVRNTEIAAKQVTLRPLTTSEIPLIAGCLQKLADHHNRINPLPEIEYPVYSIPAAVAKYTSEATAGATPVCSAWIGDTLAGFCAISMEDRNGNIDYLYLEPESRGYGVGKRLMQWALDEFKKRNLRYALLKVVIGNDDSIAFYEHCGFKPRAHCMIKPLD